MSINGERNSDDLDEFRQLPTVERDVRIYQSARGANAGTLDLYSEMGNLARELAANTVAQNKRTLVEEAIVAALVKHQPPPAKPASIPPRAPMPSIMEIRDEDITAIRELKVKAAPVLKDWADAKVVRAWWVARLKLAALVFGVITGGAAVGALIFKALAH